MSDLLYNFSILLIKHNVTLLCVKMERETPKGGLLDIEEWSNEERHQVEICQLIEKLIVLDHKRRKVCTVLMGVENTPGISTQQILFYEEK